MTSSYAAVEGELTVWHNRVRTIRIETADPKEKKIEFYSSRSWSLQFEVLYCKPRVRNICSEYRNTMVFLSAITLFLQCYNTTFLAKICPRQLTGEVSPLQYKILVALMAKLAQVNG